MQRDLSRRLRALGVQAPLLQEHVAVLSLEPEQRLFRVEATAESRQVPAAANYPVTWDDDGYWIATIGGPNGTHGFRATNSLRDIAVGRCLTVRNAA